MVADNPILNSPYEEPRQHYATDDSGALDYARIAAGRRIFAPEVQAIPIRQGPQAALFEINDRGAEYGTLLVNLLRREVGLWRASGYPGTTRVTRELLNFWFLDPDRHDNQKLFFAQQEAIETAIWINEVAPASNVGQHALNQLHEAQTVATGNADANLPRLAFKMATGTGKTVVMAMQILYHFFNRQEYRNDTRFADGFLVVTPGITIKNRLGVLYVDLERRGNAQDYYHVRSLIPRGWESKLGNLNARIAITNYHAFEPRTLSGNKRSPFDGKRDAQGKKQEAVEDFAQVARRVIGKLKAGSRLLILNDEAHHCYLPKEEGKAVEGEDTKEENKRATDRILPVLNYYNRSGSTAYVHGSTTREVYATTKSHVNLVVADTKSWEQIAAKTLEEIDAVQSYVKNAFLGFSVPYVAEGKDREYFPDFIARCRIADGRAVNLIVEITGMNDDKAEKKWHIEKRWLPAVNAVREKNGWDEWAFVEVAGDIRNIKTELLAKMEAM